MSAPCSIGRHRYGVAMVASMISGRPRSWATSASAATSVTSPEGFATISANTQRVRSVIAARNASGSSPAHERRVDPEAAQRHVELGDRAAVERGRRDDVVARAREGGERQELRGLPRAGGHRAERALEAGQALLERGDRRVRDAAVDVAVLLQREQVRGVGGVVEDEARRLVDRHGAGAGRGVGHGAGVHGARAESPGPVLVATPPFYTGRAGRSDRRFANHAFDEGFQALTSASAPPARNTTLVASEHDAEDRVEGHEHERPEERRTGSRASRAR